jgi:hypothetical protein
MAPRRQHPVPRAIDIRAPEQRSRLKNNVQHPEFGDRASRTAPLADATPPSGSRISEDQYQTISRWSVVGNDRIVGGIHNRPGTEGGGRIMTSPVVEVRFAGVDGTPVAYTESGNAYWLGLPATSFGNDRAARFVWHKARPDPEPARRAQPGSETTLMRLMD